jgi:hypothetical protein
MRRLHLLGILGIVCLWACWAQGGEWRAGLARVDITPQGPIWMAGYASRNHPSEGVLHPLWAKALALEDPAGSRLVIVTNDLIGLSRDIAETVCVRVQKESGLPRARILFNSSHTHSGPVVGDVAALAHPMNDQQLAVTRAYAKILESKLASVIDQAVKNLRPARLAFGEGRATFGINRRQVRDKGEVIPPDKAGLVDHTVPVLTLRDSSDQLLGVLFGYACHNTTLGIYQINGDYAGFAQIALEQSHSGTTALFMIGCGADTNPAPRRTVEHAQQHGKALAAAVDQALKGSLQPVQGNLGVAFARIDLPFVDPPGKEELQKRLSDKNIYQAKLAKILLERLQKGGTIDASYPYPIQVVRFGNDLALVALAGEVVVDYSLRLRKEFPQIRMWVASYSNEVPFYIPSERVLREGGYEGGGAMVYFGIHGPFKPGLENRIIEQVHKLMKQASEGGEARP